MGQEVGAEAAPELAQRAVSGAGWIAAENAFVQATSLIVFAIIAHFVSPADFGIISICFVVLQSLKVLLVDNFGQAVTRKPAAFPIEYSTAFWLTIGFSCLCFAAIEAASGLLGVIFRVPELAYVMRQTGVIILFIGLSRTHECWMARHFQFRQLAFRSGVGAATGGAVGIVLAIKGYGVQALVVQQITTSVVSLSLLWLSCPWRPRLEFSGKTGREITRFVLGLAPSGIVGILNQNCDTLLVAYFFGAGSTGLYSVAKRVRMALQQVTSTPLTGVALPALADASQDPRRLRQFFLQAVGVLCLICAPVFFGTSSIARDVVVLAFGTRWAEAGTVLVWLAAGGLGAVLLAYNDALLFVRGKPMWLFYGSGGYTVLAIACFAVAARFGPTYVAIPFVAPYLVVVPIYSLLATRQVGASFADWLRTVAPAVIAATGMFLCVRALSTYLGDLGVLIRLAILCSAGVVVYICALALVGRDELRMALVFLAGRIRRRGAAVVSVEAD